MQNCRNTNTMRQTVRHNAYNAVEHSHKDTLPHMSLAMAYVPWQRWCDIYDAEKGFCHGTIFQELDLPFRGIGGCQK